MYLLSKIFFIINMNCCCIILYKKYITILQQFGFGYFLETVTSPQSIRNSIAYSMKVVIHIGTVDDDFSPERLRNP